MAASDTDKFSEWGTRIKASDVGAFEELFREWHDPLLNYALFITKDRAVALDIAQEVFLKLWEKRATLNPNRSIKALLYLMVRNLSLNHHRDTSNRESKLADPANLPRQSLPGPDEMMDARLLKNKIQQWIADLPERQREALTLSRMQGLSHEEIAAVMDVSPRTVNNHIVRALKYIHNRVRGYEPSLLES
jgi:RNA polymerase sigma-70 factor (ECF subfamily)